MRIQRIDICGFKSFNQRAVISFDDGITGIVGPNGCGKSNVVDAIRWVMGEQSAKHLRGRAMEDVIFSGSESQGPSGMAEVALTLRNDRPAEIPIAYREFSEITVARRLYRDGRSEYLINKTGCRLLDIMELFLGTGVGTRAYSIIEQGKIGLIVNSKPEERRALIEEAAGITKYKSRKRVAERKLDYTAQNLLRIGDVVGELKRQLAALERQARKAERYRTLKVEAREIEVHEAVIEWLAAHAQLSALAESLSARVEGIAAQSEGLANAETARVEARRQVMAAETELEAWRGRAHALDLESQAQSQAQTHAQAQSLEVQRRIEQLGGDRRNAELQRGELSLERAALVELFAALEEQLGRDAAGRGEVEAQLEALRGQETEVSSDLERGRASFAQADSEAAALRERSTADERRHAELVERAERVRQDMETVAVQSGELTAKLGLSSGQSVEFHQQKLQLTERREDLERSLEQARVHFEDNEKQRRHLRDDLADRKSRLRSLEELHRNLEGHGRGVRAVLRGPGDEPAFPGVRGLMADSFQASKEIEGALEGYLEHQLQAIVVDSEQVALQGAAFLNDSSAGRATFVPLTAGRFSKGSASVVGPDHPECLGRGLDLVRVSAGAESVAEVALGQVWVMRSLAAALEARQQGAQCDLVTLRGEILWENGAVTGGVLEGAGVGALSQRREIDELGHTVADLQAQLEAAQRLHAELSHRIAGEEATLKALSADAHAHEVALVHAQQDMRRMTEQLEGLSERGQALTVEQFGLQSNLDASMEARRTTEIDLRECEGAAAAARSLLEERSAAFAVLSARSAEVRERLTELKVKAASDQQRCEATRQQLEQNDRRSEELRQRIRQAEEESAIQAGRIEILAQAANQATLRLEEVKAEREMTAVTLEAATRTHGECGAEVDRLDEHSKRLRHQVDLARAEHGKLQLREQEVTLSVTHLTSSARDRHDVDLEQEIGRFHLLPPPGEAERGRLAELREAITRIGEVNLTAIGEHEELSKRYEALSEQKQDLERSIAQLKEAIIRINRTSRERFRETFELVNIQFAQVFPRLFHGGKAGLQLIEESGEILEAGVEIFAQPPGKRLQSVNLLSGGEKALTAVALIFAIFLIKPTPFCLLDEVDAPLDDANVDRYNDIVREISKVSQFILITHNKRTMEIAETLYGVTMEEPGCSKLVSVKLNHGQSESVAA